MGNAAGVGRDFAVLEERRREATRWWQSGLSQAARWTPKRRRRRPRLITAFRKQAFVWAMCLCMMWESKANEADPI